VCPESASESLPDTAQPAPATRRHGGFQPGAHPHSAHPPPGVQASSWPCWNAGAVATGAAWRLAACYKELWLRLPAAVAAWLWLQSGSPLGPWSATCGAPAQASASSLATLPERLPGYSNMTKPCAQWTAGTWILQAVAGGSPRDTWDKCTKASPSVGALRVLVPECWAGLASLDLGVHPQCDGTVEDPRRQRRGSLFLSQPTCLQVSGTGEGTGEGAKG
jgi:hypothetical protein